MNFGDRICFLPSQRQGRRERHPVIRGAGLTARRFSPAWAVGSLLLLFSSCALSDSGNGENAEDGFAVILNHSGQAHEGEGRVLKNSLVEIIVGADSERFEDLRVVFSNPAGDDIPVPLRTTYHMGFDRSWIGHLAPGQAGGWSYRVEERSDGDAGIEIHAGDFTVYSVDGPPVPPPSQRQRLPFKVLYNNDGSKIVNRSLIGEPVTSANAGRALQSTVDEVSGSDVEVHLFCPSFTWVPWWQSDFYPMDVHWDWFRRTFPHITDPTPIPGFVLQGGDLVQTFVDHARDEGQVPFLTFRLNDHHRLNLRGDAVTPWVVRVRSRFFHEYPEYRLDRSVVRDWAIPEVRGHALSLIHELVSGYDFEGLELDFLRHDRYFREDFPPEERYAITADFIRRVRALLDEYGNGHDHRWLGIRVPMYFRGFESVGVDLTAAVEAGVDFVVLTTRHDTDQHGHYAGIAATIPHTAVYLELNHTVGLPQQRPDLWSGDRRQRMSDEQYYTTAHLAYSRGFDGVNLFNFAYHSRPHQRPVHVLRHLGDPAWLAEQPQHYFVERQPGAGRLGWTPLSAFDPLEPGESRRLELQMAPPAGGWSSTGRMRLHAAPVEGERKWRLSLNGTELEETSDVSRLYPSPVDDGFGVEEEYRAWLVPPDLPRDGVNTVTVQLLEGKPSSLNFLELGIR